VVRYTDLRESGVIVIHGGLEHRLDISPEFWALLLSGPKETLKFRRETEDGMSP